jgi:hypothetical protein
MTSAPDRRSHSGTVVLILGVAALVVASASATVLWSAYRSRGTTRVDPAPRTETPDIPGGTTSPGGRGRGSPDGRGTGVVDAADNGRGGPPPPLAKCGAAQPWDIDGDGISDSVEQNNRTLYGFDATVCDRDPSNPAGKPAGGALVRGLNLTNQGAGYLHLRGSDPPDADDWATLRMVSCIEAVGREAEALDLRITVNDLSLQPGGHFVPHASHQNGLDVDVRYVRADGRVAPLDIRQSPADYDALTTQAILQAFLRRCEVSAIFADLPSLTFTNEELDRPVLVQAPGHTNHFHVRLRPPS